MSKLLVPCTLVQLQAAITLIQYSGAWVLMLSLEKRISKCYHRTHDCTAAGMDWIPEDQYPVGYLQNTIID